jgi:hypothetical protein
VWRVGSSFLGPFKPDFMEVTMTSPDLYGPFWVATTLIFVTAVAGNYAEFIAWNRGAGGGKGGGGAGAGGGGGNGTAPIPAPGGGASPGAGLAELQWYTDYAKMSYSAVLFYGYVFVLGMALYFALRWFRWGARGPRRVGRGGVAGRLARGSVPAAAAAPHWPPPSPPQNLTAHPTTPPPDPLTPLPRSEIRLANVWCIYGYSLTIFVPMAFICIPPLGWLRWLAVMAATAVSGSFVVANLKQSIYEAAPARAVMLLGIILGCHVALGLALRLYFFAW